MSRVLIERLLRVPYMPGGSSFDGLDCWGLVEVWYLERFGMALRDRGRLEPSPLSVTAGYELSDAWRPGAHPQDDDLILMKARWAGEVIRYGHVGIYWQGSVLHTSIDHGTVCQPYRARHVESRVTAILRHRTLL